MRTIALLTLVAALAAPAFAQTPPAAPATPSAAKATAPAKPTASGARRSKPSAPRATRPTATATAKATGKPAASARTGVGPRRLEDIHIEGEIPAPQVLFITARDQRRFLGSQHRRYLRTAREVGEATPLPATVIVTRPEPAEPR